MLLYSSISPKTVRRCVLLMGLSLSSRIRAHLRATKEFNSARNVVFNHYLALNQQASAAGIIHHQLYAAIEQLYSLLSRYLRGFRRLVPCPPSRNRVLKAFRSFIIRSGIPDSTAELVLGAAVFEDLALAVFAEEIMWEMKWDIMERTLGAAVMFGVTCSFHPDQSGFLAVIFAVYGFAMAALSILALRFTFIFFRF